MDAGIRSTDYVAPDGDAEELVSALFEEIFFPEGSGQVGPLTTSSTWEAILPCHAAHGQARGPRRGSGSRCNSSMTPPRLEPSLSSVQPRVRFSGDR